MTVWNEAKQTIQLAIPIILGELSQMVLHIIDSAMVGTLTYNHLAASALVLSVVNIPFVAAIGLTFSISQLVALGNGKKDKQFVSHYFYNGVIQSCVVGLFISLLLVGGINILDHLRQDPVVVALAKPYMFYISISVIPMTLFMAFKQFADGLEHTKTAMYLSFMTIPINFFLNYLLIYGHWGFPRLELTGAGIATLITRVIQAIIMVMFILKSPLFASYLSDKTKEWKFHWGTQREHLKIGLPSSLQITMEVSAFAISGIIIGMISAKEQAAHQVALIIASVTFMVSFGFSQAGSIRVSNYFGQQNFAKIRLIGKSSIYTGLLYGLASLIGIASLNHYLPTLFNDNPDVVTIASGLLVLAAVFQISDSLQAVATGLLRGIKDLKFPAMVATLAYWVVGIPIGYYLAFHGQMNASGIWVGFIIGLTVSAVLLSFRFRYFIKKLMLNT